MKANGWSTASAGSRRDIGWLPRRHRLAPAETSAGSRGESKSTPKEHIRTVFGVTSQACSPRCFPPVQRTSKDNTAWYAGVLHICSKPLKPGSFDLLGGVPIEHQQRIERSSAISAHRTTKNVPTSAKSMFNKTVLSFIRKSRIKNTTWTKQNKWITLG